MQTAERPSHSLCTAMERKASRKSSQSSGAARREKKRPSRVLKLQIRLAKETKKDEDDDEARKHFARLKPLQFNTGGQ